MSTLAEKVCAAAHRALQGATDAGGNVHRRRLAAYTREELPAIEISRGLLTSDIYAAGTDKATLEFRVALIVAEGEGAETALDALHAQANAALLGDADLAALGKGLRLVETAEPELVAGDPDVARLLATYSIQILYRRADLARAVR